MQEQRILTPRSLQQPTTPLPFQHKRSLNSNSGKVVLWDTSPSSSQSAGFPNKVTIPCLNNSSLDLLVFCVASSPSLDSVTKLSFWEEGIFIPNSALSKVANCHYSTSSYQFEHDGRTWSSKLSIYFVIGIKSSFLGNSRCHEAESGCRLILQLRTFPPKRLACEMSKQIS